MEIDEADCPQDRIKRGWGGHPMARNELTGNFTFIYLKLPRCTASVPPKFSEVNNRRHRRLNKKVSNEK